MQASQLDKHQLLMLQLLKCNSRNIRDAQNKTEETRTKSIPLQIWTKPVMIMRARAKSLPAVKTSWTHVAQRTLKQFTQVSSTETAQSKSLTRFNLLQNQAASFVNVAEFPVKMKHIRRQTAARRRKAVCGGRQVGKSGCRT